MPRRSPSTYSFLNSDWYQYSPGIITKNHPNIDNSDYNYNLQKKTINIIADQLPTFGLEVRMNLLYTESYLGVLPKPIGSMVLIYMLTLGVY